MMTADERLSHEAWLSVIDKAISDIEEYHQRMINEGRYSRFNTEEMGQQRLDAMMDVRQSIVWNKAQGNLPIEIARQHAELMRQTYTSAKENYEYYQSIALRPGLLSSQARYEGYMHAERIIKNYYNTVINTKG